MQALCPYKRFGRGDICVKPHWEAAKSYCRSALSFGGCEPPFDYTLEAAKSQCEVPLRFESGDISMTIHDEICGEGGVAESHCEVAV